MKLAKWAESPPGIRAHLALRLADRKITMADLHRLRFWVDSQPEVPEGEWFKDFGTFKLCGVGSLPKTFLDPHQSAWGEPLD